MKYIKYTAVAGGIIAMGYLSYKLITHYTQKGLETTPPTEISTTPSTATPTTPEVTVTPDESTDVVAAANAATKSSSSFKLRRAAKAAKAAKAASKS